MNAVAKSPTDDPALGKLLEADAALCKLGRKIRVLDAIGWPADMESQFLAGWRAGKPAMPKPPTQPQKLDEEIAALEALMKTIDRGHPIGHWLWKSAWSYRVAAQMLTQIGKPGFTECSTLLYGRPDTLYKSQGDLTAADAAADMLDTTDKLIDTRLLPEVPCDLTAAQFAERIRERIEPFFTDDKVELVLDPALASKAAAGSKKITLRSTAMFSELDIEQLVQHEAFIHTATLLNGKHQPYLKTLGVGTPRTTRTQEGLATFSEIITGAIDINRLRRVALRVIRVKEALDGADFMDVFRAFLEAGQNDVESYRSAARVFRGGDVNGRICFTKDGAYLEGVIMVYCFIRRALQEGRSEVLRLLFCGRVTTADVVSLAPYRDSGLIAPAHYVPPWARSPDRVLSIMAFSAAVQRYRLDTFDLDRFVDYEDEQIAASGIG
ncbi:flavohemoglobin expression-modulating QEGLA motif protein [Lysobacter sp. KIS68-7]|uniref:tyrosine/phenylalanine carboxypeptidase domain-containing protein n=1 Tax=Lysobacter sp. KIS68-7 TaxID=2904252 RepID=UPI001E313C8A|nr:tyrosine/phenylalanine carboxypeptidase domain-containing protein [Lysobacter sp. KIS68-7]UHQ18875.1 flavohemoglobin expression-modulating QEGLA motif protein [Lysobacter sp. KIS68-7]